MRTLLVDNYDSYTFNLFQLIAEINGIEPVVLRNDADDWDDLDLTAFDNVVISPGPGRPGPQRDLGRALTVLDQSALPVLGVCLGHQAMVYAAGGEIAPAPRVRHGYLSRIRHTGVELFAGIPQDFTAVRYHSLCASEPLPAALEVTARAEDGVIMAIRHRHLPQWGVQFHPESIESEHGLLLLTNFRDLTRSYRRVSATRDLPDSRASAPASAHTSAPVPTHSQARARDHAIAAVPSHATHTVILDHEVDCEQTFHFLYGESDQAFWLDSSRIEPGMSRFSFMGDTRGPLGETLSYRVGSGFVTIQPAEGSPYSAPGNIFDVLQERLARCQVPGDELPFGLNCGYVGYFGYELKQDCGSTNRHTSEVPDAYWLLADRLIAVDHAEHRTYLVALTDGTARVERAQRDWLERTTSVLKSPKRPRCSARIATSPSISARTEVDGERYLVRGRDQYLADITSCLEALSAGESYEICLTNKARLPASRDDLAYYRALRQVNPAPYAAFLRLPDITIMSSSPECFLRLGAGGAVESKPIKGTAPRGADPALDAQLRLGLTENPKTYAENLMIVDLLRNDLGQVCRIGSVSVPEFLAVESYPTVHQLVSTVTGQLREDVSPVECVQACFPGGSMTGAPKLRTMEIIDTLETEARGIYSGSLGYFGLGGAAELNIVIRTAVRHNTELSVGGGGAIVIDSNPQEEYEEMLLKVQTPLSALRHGYS